MSILTCEVPASWPSDAKALVGDLRKAYRALEQSFDSEAYVLKVDPELSSALTMEARQYGFEPAEVRLWRALRSNSRGVWGKSALHAALYPSGEPRSGMKIVDIHIHKMRKRLFVAKAPWYIKTFWGEGYQLVASADASAIGYNTGQKATAEQRLKILSELPSGLSLPQSALKSALVGLGLSQVAMAQSLGLRPKLVFEWCNGVALMPDRYARSIMRMARTELCKLRGVSPSRIVRPVPHAAPLHQENRAA